MTSIFQVNTPGRAYGWLLGLALVRGVLDYFWWFPLYSRLEVWLSTLLNTTVYLFTLYLVIPALAGIVLQKAFSRRVDDSAVLRGSVLIWVVYPAVTIISLLTKSPPTQSIPLFSNVPSFMVDYNFLPTGMIAVIPMLVLFYTQLLTRHSEAEWPKVILAVLASLTVVYLVYYQYTLWLFLYLYLHFNLLVVFGCATLTYLAPLLPLAQRFHAAFGHHRVALPRLVLLATILSLALLVAGLLISFAS